MVLLNQSTREITAKVVYYGLGLCGKTSNIQFIYDTLDEDQRGKMLSLATDTDRTLFFDFMPMELGTVRGFKVRVQLYTVPGQVFYAETRKRVLKGADGVVFVADSQRTMRAPNRESFSELKEHLIENGLDPDTIPTVLQYNKRDLKSICTVEEMDADLNPSNLPFFEAIAKEGVGVEDTLRCISKLVLKRLMGQTLESAPARAVPKPPPPRPAKGVPAVVMDPRKLLTELGVSPANAKAKSQAPTAPADPIPASGGADEILLGEADAMDAQLLEASSDPLLLGGAEEDLLGGGAAPPLFPVPPAPEISESEESPLGGPSPELELAVLDDPPALITDSHRTFPEEPLPTPEVTPRATPPEPFPEAVPTQIPQAPAPMPPTTGLTLAPGQALELSVVVGDRRFRLFLRLEEEP